MVKRALVLANGERQVDRNYFHNLRKRVDTLICADGGAKFALQLGLKPDRIFGDLDSINPDVKERYEKMGIEFVLFPAEKDKTDTHLILDYLIAEGYKEVFVGGAFGGRPDHFMGNLVLLNYGHQYGVKVKLVSPTVEIQILEGELVIEGHKGDTFSLIPVDHVVRGVTLKGFKYSLTDAEIFRESTLAISNIIVSDQARVKIKEGRAFLFIISRSEV
ncbi:thiamine pyrophosphokinase [Anoxybacter fermentans]|uniref:Thiamine diphosphokinase n=1 Tax=Anoxybacter fermentans TaxID=1323375 RepID=A0A3S9SXG7_9FIRM|nr:thiamine diphosphokinase [Anoxybacter fermentans]AZR72950.1 thiamine pyrophosphokinase [Anoxybacter fermentans]